MMGKGKGMLASFLFSFLSVILGRKNSTVKKRRLSNGSFSFSLV